MLLAKQNNNKIKENPNRINIIKLEISLKFN